MTEDEQKLDGELVRRILSGEENAFDALYHRHKSRLYGFIANRINDHRDAEELVNDTFLKARKHLHTLQEPEKVLNWMYSIASQLIAGWYQKHKKPGATQDYTDVYETEGEAAAAAVIYQTTQEYAMETERWTAVSVAIAQLPELEQRMIGLQLDGEKYTDIAEICETSVSAGKKSAVSGKEVVERLGDGLGSRER